MSTDLVAGEGPRRATVAVGQVTRTLLAAVLEDVASRDALAVCASVYVYVEMAASRGATA